MVFYFSRIDIKSRFLTIQDKTEFVKSLQSILREKRAQGYRNLRQYIQRPIFFARAFVILSIVFFP